MYVPGSTFLKWAIRGLFLHLFSVFLNINIYNK